MNEENKPLPESEFIKETKGHSPTPLVWLFIILVFIATGWGIGSLYMNQLQEQVEKSPFLRVSNRDFSLFLWQNPEFMKANRPNKTGYLPGFASGSSFGVIPERAEEIVSAPPEVLFRYHTWDRLLKREYSPRAISLDEFKQFLEQMQEWSPSFWPGAPKAYVELVEELSSLDLPNLQLLPKSTLPLEVRIAFQGWKNFFLEGEKINKLRPTRGQMKQFLLSHPHYARNYWINLLWETTPHYLENKDPLEKDASEVIPANELTSFLRVAFYNYIEE